MLAWAVLCFPAPAWVFLASRSVQDVSILLYLLMSMLPACYITISMLPACFRPTSMVLHASAQHVPASALALQRYRMCNSKVSSRQAVLGVSCPQALHNDVQCMAQQQLSHTMNAICAGSRGLRPQFCYQEVPPVHFQVELQAEEMQVKSLSSSQDSCSPQCCTESPCRSLLSHSHKIGRPLQCCRDNNPR